VLSWEARCRDSDHDEITAASDEADFAEHGERIEGDDGIGGLIEHFPDPPDWLVVIAQQEELKDLPLHKTGREDVDVVRQLFH
jgi:hypothetical protein